MLKHVKKFSTFLILGIGILLIYSNPAQAQWNFIRGDANGNGQIDPDDFTTIFEIIARDSIPGCADAADVNDDGQVTFADRDYLGNYIFQDSAPPPPPFPNCGCDPTPDTLTCTFTQCTMSTFTRGDVNCDGVVDSQDSVFLDNFLLGGTAPSCLDAADVNDDAVVNSADLIYLSDYLNSAGPPPPAPFPAPCIDPTCDTLTCDSTCYPLECSDGIDNDGDGLKDYLADCGCSQPCDEFEAPNPVTECNDGIDNDGDGFIDLADCGCVNSCDSSETPATQCSDGLDNDGDGLVDFPADCGCTSDCDRFEGPNPTTQCNDGIDNDSDGLVDYPSDCGCENVCDTSEAPNPQTQCSDGIDNDGDGLIDLADTHCVNICDNSELFVCWYKPGDFNGTGAINLADIIGLVGHVFKGAPRPDPKCRGDANGNGSLTLTDIVYLVNFVFKAGPDPLPSGICCLPI